MNCPYCASEIEPSVLVCSSCSRDVGVPASLIAERDDLVRKIDGARDELFRMREEIDSLMHAKKRSRS